VDHVPAGHHLFIVHQDPFGDNNGVDYLAAGHSFSSCGSGKTTSGTAAETEGSWVTVGLMLRGRGRLMVWLVLWLMMWMMWWMAKT
jgi:hypothetical protein